TRQSEHEVHAVVLTPTHQLVAAEAGIPAENDLGGRPRRSNLRHDSLYFLHAAEGRVMIGFAQTRAEYVFSAEDVQRQIAIVVVIAMEEPTLLLAVQRQVGSLHIQDDLRRSLVVRLDEHLDQQFIYCLFPEGDLLV